MMKRIDYTFVSLISKNSFPLNHLSK